MQYTYFSLIMTPDNKVEFKTRELAAIVQFKPTKLPRTNVLESILQFS